MKILLVTIAFFATISAHANISILTADTTSTAAPQTASLNLASITRNMTTINPRFVSIKGASLTFNSKTLNMTINRGMLPCPAGELCAQVMPAPIQVNLPVVQVVNTPCSVKYIAQTPADTSSTIFEEVTVEDFSFSRCEMLLNTVGKVTYKVTGVSSLTKQPETATANFSVSGQFIRAENM